MIPSPQLIPRFTDRSPSFVSFCFLQNVAINTIFNFGAGLLGHNPDQIL